MTAALVRTMQNNDQTSEDDSPPSVQKEVDRILLRLRQSKAFMRAVGHTMGTGGYGSIKLDMAAGKVTRIISEAISLMGED